MNVIEPIEIVLDKPRKLMLGHWGLYTAEMEINKQRGAKPEEHVAIDFMMVDAYNRIFLKTGLLPLDLMVCVLWAGLLHEDPKITKEKVAALMDQSQLSRADLSAKVWAAYFSSSKNSLKVSTESDDVGARQDAPAEDGEKKTDKTSGSNSGPQGGLH